MNNQKKILIIAPAWIGDLIMSQALFRLLKQQNPDCSIDVLANKNLHPILKQMPEVDHCLILPFNHGELKLYKRYQLAKKLRKKFYTHAYILPNSFKSALIPFWAHIPSRTGWLGEFRYILLNQIKTAATKTPLMVERFIALGGKKDKLLSKSLLPKLRVSTKQAKDALKNLKITPSQKPILALCPGAEYGITKRWPTAYFAEIAKTKKKEGWKIWIFGGPKEKNLAREIQTKSNDACLDLTGKTDLGEVIKLLSLATVVVTNDSGLMHIAAALNKPLVTIYGSTSPKFTPPLTDKAKILSLNLSCSPCMQRKCPLKHLNCMNNIKPKLVLAAIKEITK